MKKQIADRWIAALESNEYKQGRGRLRNKKNEFCCLGVLCNLHAQDHPKLAATEKHPTIYLGFSGILSSPVISWAGMSTANGLFKNTSLTELNDKHKFNFEQIAAFIRTNYKAL